jgi:hypothetical protein
MNAVKKPAKRQRSTKVVVRSSPKKVAAAKTIKEKPVAVRAPKAKKGIMLTRKVQTAEGWKRRMAKN